MHAEYILMQFIKASEDFFKKILLSLYLKGLCVREGVRDRTELQYIDPPLSWPSVLCLSRSPRLLNRRPGGSLCLAQAFFTISCHQRVSKLNRGSRGPLLLGGGFPYHHLSPTHLLSNSLTDFLSPPSYIIVQSPTQSLEWHVWSSSSGNNCHAVHRSLSSGASVYECTIGFYLVPFFQPSPPTRFLLITAIGMCHFLPVHHFGMACLARSKVNIKQIELTSKNQVI